VAGNGEGRIICGNAKDHESSLIATHVAAPHVIFEGNRSKTSAFIAKRTEEKSAEEKGFWSSKSQYSFVEAVDGVTPTTIVSKTTSLKTKEGRYSGTDFVGLILEDNTNEGAEFGPTISRVNYVQRAVNESALSNSDVGCEGWYEIMQPCRLAVNEVIRKIDGGHITLTCVDWDRNRTKIIGKFAEVSYELKKWHTQWARHEQALPDGALVVVALAVSLATYGAGASFLSSALGVKSLGAVGTAMANGGFAALCSNAAVSFGRHGNPLEAAQEMVSNKSLRSFAITLASAGICAHIGSTLNIDMNPGLKSLLGNKPVEFTDFLKVNAIKAMVETPLNSVIGQQPIHQSLWQGAKNLGIDSVASYAAYNIGKLYSTTIKPIGYIEHKALHGIVGGTAGWLINPTQRGLISGAIGSIASEVIMDARRDIVKDKALTLIDQTEQEGQAIDVYEFTQKLQEAVWGDFALARLGGASVAALLGQDAAVAFHTGTTAVENNAILAAVGLGLAVLEVYDVYRTWREEGAKAALEKVAVDGVVIIVTGAGVKVTVAVAELSAFMAELVWYGYMAQNPAFVQVASRMANKVVTPLVAGAAKAKEWYDKVDAPLEAAFSKVWQKVKSVKRGGSSGNPAKGAYNEFIPEFNQEARELFDTLGIELTSTAESTGQLIIKGTQATLANQIDPLSAQQLWNLRQQLAKFVYEGDRLNHSNPLVKNFAHTLKASLEEANILMPRKEGMLLTPEQARTRTIIKEALDRVKERSEKGRDIYYGKGSVEYEGRKVVPGQLLMKYRRNYNPLTVNNNRPDFNHQPLYLVNGKNTDLIPLIPRPIESSYYSTIFEVRLTPDVHFPGKPERLHFRESNKQLHQFLESNPTLKVEFDKTYPGLFNFIKPSQKGIYPNKSPAGLSWHHNVYEEGLMELIPRPHHKAPGPVHHNLHPNKKGGMETWGGGYRKKNTKDNE